MAKITAADLVREISRLDRNTIYRYTTGNNALKIVGIDLPEGPIRFVRVKGDRSNGNLGSISKQQLAQMALVCSNKPNFPLHIDRVFSGGGNTRSAFEALLAHTPNFFMCYPQRVDAYSGETLTNLKHIMWCPDDAHPLGEIVYKDYHQVITEVELGVDFGNIQLQHSDLSEEFDTIEAKTTHIQMQIALIEIGNALNFRTWIARPDMSIRVGDKRLGEFEGVIQSLDEMDILYNRDIKEKASLIDCIWFTADGNRIPAIIEIEHSTGVTSGLTRMLKLRNAFPSITTTFTVVASNRLRNKVVSEANQPTFSDLKARYMPYSTVRELYGLIQRYSLSGIVDHRFIEPFMEKVTDS